jgi:hypothetical protein
MVYTEQDLNQVGISYATEETRKKMSKLHTGNKYNLNKVASPETRLKKALTANPQGHKLLSPEGQIHFFYIMIDFCKEHNLNVGNICQLLKGKKNIVQGWKRVEEDGN